MRSGSKRVLIGMGTLLIAAALAAPSFAGKKAVSDDELDMVTAAGQPVIIEGGTTVTATFTAVTDMAQTIQTGSQTNLRALALNNVVGENQVANGININGGSSNSSLTQANTITQSWGATADITIAGIGAATGAIAPSCAGALICKATTQVTVVGGFARRLERAADIIIDAGTSATVTYAPVTSVVSSIDGGAQTGLVALVVNNVAGLNQVSNGVNLFGNSMTLGSGGVSTTVNPNATAGTQSNSLGAYRGTPANFSRVP